MTDRRGAGKVPRRFSRLGYACGKYSRKLIQYEWHAQSLRIHNDNDDET